MNKLLEKLQKMSKHCGYGCSTCETRESPDGQKTCPDYSPELLGAYICFAHAVIEQRETMSAFELADIWEAAKWLKEQEKHDLT